MDSITRSATLCSAWENEEKLDEREGTPLPPPTKVSPVYSMDVHSDGVWLLTGLENGSINLWTVRIEEGTVCLPFLSLKLVRF
jgi:transcriptional activator SPT8